MFKLPTSFTNPVLVQHTLADLFNPMKNDYFIRDRKYVNAAEWRAAYTALFTRENILNNPNCFYPLETLGGYLDHGDIPQFLNKIDDEDLWLLGFFTMTSVGSGNKLQWIISTPQMVDTSSSSRRVDCHISRVSWNNQYSFAGANFHEEMTTKLKAVGAAWKELVDRYEGYSFNFEPLIYNQLYLTKIMAYVSNRRTWHSSEHTPQSLKEEMILNPSMTVRVSAENWQGVKVSISNPVTKGNKAALFSTLPYSADVLELLPWPLVLKGERDPLLMGVELEVSTRYTTQQLIEATDEPFMACKQDSSISGSMRNKVEMVTCPMSVKAQKREWSHFFSNLDYDWFDTTIETNNGMHVHIEKKKFSDAHLRSFAWFFGNPCNRDFIVALSERKPNTMHQYSAMPNWPATYSKTSSLKTVVQMFDALRGAVNIGKTKPTIEVRIFKGIASYATIVKNLEAVDAIFHFTQQCSQTAAGLKHFLRFVDKAPRNKYPVLKEFLAGLDTKKMLSTAELQDILFNVVDPRKIVSIIEKKNFPITSHHVSFLNAKQGVRTFIFNKETGTMEIVRTKHGKMSHLDRVLEQKYTRRTPAPLVEEIQDRDTTFVPMPMHNPHWMDVPIPSLDPSPTLSYDDFVRAQALMNASIPPGYAPISSF